MFSARMVIDSPISQVSSTESAISLTVIVLTFNEELHIARCLANVQNLAERIIVVDSFSTDRTTQIAAQFGAEVVQRSFANQADQLQWALDTLQLTSDWILRIDADEYLEDVLKQEIRSRVPKLPEAVAGVNLKRKVIFRGKWIRWGGIYPSIFLRLWRTGAGRVEQRWMDEHTLLTRGESVTFHADFVDHNLQDITWWTEKHNRFTTRQMVDLVNIEYGLFPVDRGMEAATNTQAKFKRFLRNKVFRRAPLYLRGLLYFAQRYVLRLGFLDGREGFVFHFLQGCWNWILIDAKIDEAHRFIKVHGIGAFKAHLRERHGIDLGVGPR